MRETSLGESVSNHNLPQGLNVTGLGRVLVRGIYRREAAREVLGWEMPLPRLPAPPPGPGAAAGLEPERRLETLDLPPF